MALLLKPHNGVYFGPKTNRAMGVRTATTMLEGRATQGQMTPEGASESFASSTAEALNPRRYLCDLADGQAMEAGGVIELDQFPGTIFKVVAQPIPWAAIPAYSFCEILCEELNHTHA